MIATEIPIKIISTANARLNRFKLASMNRSHRTTVHNALAQVAQPPELPLTIVLTRIGPKMLDTDNLAGGFKAVRDGIADWLHVDDGSDQLDWQYRQRCAGAGVYYVEVEVI